MPRQAPAAGDVTLLLQHGLAPSAPPSVLNRALNTSAFRVAVRLLELASPPPSRNSAASQALPSAYGALVQCTKELTQRGTPCFTVSAAARL